jgi:hypothetical protein
MMHPLLSPELKELLLSKLKRARELEDLIYDSSPLIEEKKELTTVLEEIDFITEEVDYEFEEQSEY